MGKTKIKRSRKEKKIDTGCKASSFRDLRNLKDSDSHYVLDKVLTNEISVTSINSEARQLKQMKEVQTSMTTALGETDWSTVKER